MLPAGVTHSTFLDSATNREISSNIFPEAKPASDQNDRKFDGRAGEKEKWNGRGQFNKSKGVFILIGWVIFSDSNSKSESKNFAYRPTDVKVVILWKPNHTSNASAVTQSL